MSFGTYLSKWLGSYSFQDSRPPKAEFPYCFLPFWTRILHHFSTNSVIKLRFCTKLQNWSYDRKLNKKNALGKKCCNKISTLWIYPNFCVTVIESNSILCGVKKIRDGYNFSLGTKKIVNLKFVSLFFNPIFLFQKLLVL